MFDQLHFNRFAHAQPTFLLGLLTQELRYLDIK